MALSLERWSGKVAVVTGASSGIGTAISKQLVEQGVIVAGFARRVVKLEILSKELINKKGKFRAVKCDITKENDIKNAFQWVKDNLGPVHILINNAGIPSTDNLTEGSFDAWKKVLDTNVIGLCICTREAAKDMQSSGVDGHIIHINSVAGHTVPNFPNMSLYPASKFAVTALTETLRNELNSIKSRIRITSISPGAVQTEILKVAGISKEYAKQVIGDIKILDADDVADTVTYVLSTPAHVQVHEVIIKPVGERF